MRVRDLSFDSALSRLWLLVFILICVSGDIVQAAGDSDVDLDFQLKERARLESIQLKVLAQRTLMDWIRNQSIKTAGEKFDAEKMLIAQF